MPNVGNPTAPSRRRVFNLAVISAVVLLFAVPACAGDMLWPLKLRPDLSSGFGEFRLNRFHAGLDLRTGGRTGQRVYSPVDGYVWRIKMSYDGYGKGLYVKGDDGYVYVFAHLSQFISRIDRVVRQAQVAARRYYLDKYFPVDSIRVSMGEVIAFTGQTGTGAPHLHFERRSPDNVPLNPLSHGLSLNDTIAPTFTRLGIELTGARSLLPNAQRRIHSIVPDSLQGTDIMVPGALYLDRNFGVVTGCYDKGRTYGMRQTVYKLTLLVDGVTQYTSVFDSLPFERGAEVNLTYDQQAADTGDTRVRRLYRRGKSDGRAHNGVLGPSLDFGLHHCVITAEDNAGNRSRLRFDILWGGTEGLYVKDSAVRLNDSLKRYYFTPAGDVSELGIDSTIVEIVQGENAYRTDLCKVVEVTPGRLIAEVRGKHLRTRVFRLRHFSSYGPTFIDDPFHGMFAKGQKALEVSHQVLDDGLLVTAHSNALRAIEARLLLYDGDRLLGTERPDRFFSIAYYHFFVPPLEKYRRVDRIGVALGADTIPVVPTFESDLTLGVVGFQPAETLAADSLMFIEAGSDYLFEPMWLELRKTRVNMRYRLGLLSDVYDIFPAVFGVRKRFDVHLSLPPPTPFSRNERSGIGWLDETEDEWVWLEDSELDDNKLTASSFGGGTFGAVIDNEPPFITGENIVNERTYFNLMPTFEFKLGDSLSGIENDLSIVITVDDELLIPEYDPEREFCIARPESPLSEGRHKLKIVVTDRAGNSFDEAWYIRTVAPPQSKMGKR